MDLAELACQVEKQELGAELELRHPVTGAPTGMVLVIAGPDSAKQQLARREMHNSFRSTMSASGQAWLDAEVQDRLTLQMLAHVVLSWNVTENGKPIPCNHHNVVRLLSAGTWVRDQVDAFAASRAPYFASSPKPDAEADSAKA